jgi:hypothetical protein
MQYFSTFYIDKFLRFNRQKIDFNIPFLGIIEYGETFGKSTTALDRLQ